VALRLLVSVAALLALTSSAFADFAKASCDTPAFKSFMLARLGRGKSLATGKLMTDRFDFGPIVSATTVSNTGRAISCEISVDLDTRSGTRLVHGRFTATAGTSGRNSWRWLPGN
jgi:hypothetical protein